MKKKQTDEYIDRFFAENEPVASTRFIDKIMERYSIDLNAPEHIISNQWNKIVGNNLSQMTVFQSIENGIVKVRCTNSSAATLLRMNSGEILKNLRSLFPELTFTKIITFIK